MVAKWVDVGPLDELPPGSKMCLEVAGKSVIVCHVGGQVIGVSNICPHAGQPIGDGDLRGRVLTCPYHDYAYDVLTGRNVVFPHQERPLTRFPTRCTQQGRVEVELPHP